MSIYIYVCVFTRHSTKYTVQSNNQGKKYFLSFRIMRPVITCPNSLIFPSRISNCLTSAFFSSEKNVYKLLPRLKHSTSSCTTTAFYRTLQADYQLGMLKEPLKWAHFICRKVKKQGNKQPWCQLFTFFWHPCICRTHELFSNEAPIPGNWNWIKDITSPDSPPPLSIFHAHSNQPRGHKWDLSLAPTGQGRGKGGK